MKYVRQVLIAFSFIFVFAQLNVRGQGYRIEVSIKGLSNDTLILGEYFTTRMIPMDTIILDKQGKGAFSGDSLLSGGLYLIYFNPGRYFDFLLGDDQQFIISTDTASLMESLRFEGSKDNTVFQEYRKHLEQKRSEKQLIQKELETASNATDSSRINDRQMSIDREMEAYMDRMEEAYRSLFVSDFIGATREPVALEELLKGQQRYDDSVKYFYYKDHYFDRFNPFDTRLLHTPIYQGKIMNYITRAVPQHPDSLIVAVDFLLQGAKKDPEMYRYMLITLFNHFAESKFMGMDVVYFHIAEYYYIPDASWSGKDFIIKLKENLELNKPTLIGQIAPNLLMRRVPPEHFQMAAEDTVIKKDPHIGENFFIHEVEAPYTILYFWEADCGHCEKATPVLYDVYSRLKDKGLKVISVHVINTIEGKEKWVDFINEHGMYDWINCWSPYSNEFRRTYNLQAYPQLFLFDRDKRIVAKRITPEQAEHIINNLISLESNK